MVHLFRNRYSISKIFLCGLAFTLVAGRDASAQSAAPTPPAYDLLLHGGHVLDDKNHIDATMDVAIKDGKIAKVAEHISPSEALKAIDVKGLYVTPGLIDMIVDHKMKRLLHGTTEAEINDRCFALRTYI